MRRTDNLIGPHAGNDGYVRSQVKAKCTELFALLNLHTHGDEYQGRLLGDAQYHLAQVVQLMDDVERG